MEGRLRHQAPRRPDRGQGPARRPLDDAGEKKTHEAVREKRGRLIRSAQKSYGNVRADIERIIGTAESD